MWKRVIGLLVLALILVCGTSVGAAKKWYPGIVHAHSTFSDGDRIFTNSIESVLNAGCIFYINTDHHYQIDTLVDQSGKKKIGAKFAENWGFEDYLDTLSSVPTVRSKPVPIISIAGTEVGYSSHTLVFGDLTIEQLEQLSTVENDHQGTIKKANEWGILAVAAHPHFRSSFPRSVRFWEGTTSFYQKDSAEGVNGIEFFNDGKAEGYSQTRDWYLSLIAQRKDVFATAGCDSHSALEPGDPDRWQRKTWVCAAQLSKDSIMEAFRQGKTYAANHGASLEDLNVIPGFQTQEVDVAEFLFKVRFENEVTSDKTVRVYRDGMLAKESVKSFPAGAKEMDYQWEDKRAAVGKHSYVIEVEGCLVTSPICLDVTTSAVLETSKPERTSSTGGIPIMLGKTRAEVEETFGQPHQTSGIAKNTYLYQETPNKYYRLAINFLPNGEKYDPWTSYNQVGSGVLSLCYHEEAQMQNCLRPAQVVPGEILNRRPSHIYRAMFKNSVAAIWYSNQKTYVLILLDRPSRPLYKTVVGRSGARHYVNKNTFDFSRGYVEHFAYTDEIII